MGPFSGLELPEEMDGGSESGDCDLIHFIRKRDRDNPDTWDRLSGLSSHYQRSDDSSFRKKGIMLGLCFFSHVSEMFDRRCEEGDSCFPLYSSFCSQLALDVDDDVVSVVEGYAGYYKPFYKYNQFLGYNVTGLKGGVSAYFFMSRFMNPFGQMGLLNWGGCPNERMRNDAIDVVCETPWEEAALNESADADEGGREVSCPSLSVSFDSHRPTRFQGDFCYGEFVDDFARFPNRLFKNVAGSNHFKMYHPGNLLNVVLMKNHRFSARSVSFDAFALGNLDIPEDCRFDAMELEMREAARSRMIQMDRFLSVNWSYDPLYNNSFVYQESLNKQHSWILLKKKCYEDWAVQLFRACHCIVYSKKQRYSKKNLCLLYTSPSPRD